MYCISIKDTEGDEQTGYRIGKIKETPFENQLKSVTNITGDILQIRQHLRRKVADISCVVCWTGVGGWGDMKQAQHAACILSLEEQFNLCDLLPQTVSFHIYCYWCQLTVSRFHIFPWPALS